MAREFKTYPLLLPFAWLYGLGVGVRNALFRMGWLHERSFGLPLIGVGNLAVGGTGKTPHTEYLLRLLSGRYRTAVLSRGYGRRTRGFRLVTASDTAAAVGDEPLQMKRRFPGVVVAVDGNRCEGVERLLAMGEKCPEVIVLDDVFQHRYIRPGLSLLLTDFSRLYIDDCLLPAGRLREPASGSGRADVVVVTKCPTDLTARQRAEVEKRLHLRKGQPVFFTGLGYGPLRSLDAVAEDAGGEDVAGCSVLLVAGIAQPAPLIAELQRRGARVTPLLFPDHHLFTARDLGKIADAFGRMPGERRLIVTTEKDAVRLTALPGLDSGLRAAIRVQPVAVVFVDGKESQFNQLIIDYVRTSSGNSSLD